MDYSHFITPKSASRKPSAIRSLLKYLSVPGMISLGGGNPHPNTFPFKEMSIVLKNNETIHITEQEMNIALQYSSTNGIPPFVEWLKQLVILQHSPPFGKDFDVCIGNGSQDVLTKAFEMLIQSGDSILIESPAYSGSLSFLKPLGCTFIEIPVDEFGLNANEMASILDSWPSDKPRPRVLYTVPIGGNPSGISTSLSRKQEIYALAQTYNLLIIEDDPYFNLQFDVKIPSYFSMDIDKRVLRFDSFSKILSAGVRIGWVSGPKELVDRIVLHSQASNLHPSGVSQTFLYTLLNKWGHSGFLQHTLSVAEFYKNKRDLFLKSAERHLTGLSEWTVPSAGMFVWITIPSITDTAALISTKAIEKKVIFVPGFEFYPNPRVSNSLRAAYSIANEQEIDLALSRLAELIKSLS